MNKIKTVFSHKIFKIFLWVFLFLIVSFLILVIVRIPHAIETQKIDDQVVKIHSTKIHLSDVMGENLPPDPGIMKDQTVQGVDANHNGIRDDVELAIFKKYPNSVKTRAVLLQYALVLQMEITQPFDSTVTATEIAREESRSFACVGSIVPVSKNDIDEITSYLHFVEKLQFNTNDRISAQTIFFKNVRSYSDLPDGCDIDLARLPN